LVALALGACSSNNGGTDSGSTGNNDTGSGGNDSGSGGNDSGSGGNDSGSGSDSGPTTPTCAAYCTAITAACTGVNRQYGATDGAAMDSCMTACTAFMWSVGTSMDTSGNTLGCHLYHAMAAAGSDLNHSTHCPHAGPLGGGMCGTSNCADFCADDAVVCSGTYATPDLCMTACATWSDMGSATSPTAASGNTLACRMYHLTAAAAAGGAATHCPHTGATGGGVCQ
jgi:hypothetical protein